MSLDSLIGFLPYRNLAAKWKFLAFETWLRRKGGDPSLYKQSLGLEDGYEVHDSSIEPESISVSEVAGEDQESLPSKPKIEDLLRAYNQEKSKFLSSFIGQVCICIYCIVLSFCCIYIIVVSTLLFCRDSECQLSLLTEIQRRYFSL